MYVIAVYQAETSTGVNFHVTQQNKKEKPAFFIKLRKNTKKI